MFPFKLGIFVTVLPIFRAFCYQSKWVDPGEAPELLTGLEPGDLLEFDRGTYKHWAVYVGTRHDLSRHSSSADHRFVCPYCGGFLGGVSLLRRVTSFFLGSVVSPCSCDRHFVVHRANPADSNILGVVSRSQSASKGALGIGNIILEDLMDVWSTSLARKNNQLDHSHPPVSPQETIARVFERLLIKGTELLGDEYNVVLNNCEHFAMWVRYGRKDSAQVTRWTVIVSVILLGVGVKLCFRRPMGGLGLAFMAAGAVLLAAVLIGRFIRSIGFFGFGVA